MQTKNTLNTPNTPNTPKRYHKFLEPGNGMNVRIRRDHIKMTDPISATLFTSQTQTINHCIAVAIKLFEHDKELFIKLLFCGDEKTN